MPPRACQPRALPSAASLCGRASTSPRAGSSLPAPLPYPAALPGCGKKESSSVACARMPRHACICWMPLRISANRAGARSRSSAQRSCQWPCAPRPAAADGAGATATASRSCK
eukprot:2254379-Pleurochrysis_carterae.AAC.1